MEQRRAGGMLSSPQPTTNPRPCDEPTRRAYSWSEAPSHRDGKQGSNPRQTPQDEKSISTRINLSLWKHSNHSLSSQIANRVWILYFRTGGLRRRPRGPLEHEWPSTRSAIQHRSPPLLVRNVVRTCIQGLGVALRLNSTSLPKHVHKQWEIAHE